MKRNMSISFEKSSGSGHHQFKSNGGHNCRHYSTALVTSPHSSQMSCHRSLSTDNKYAFKRPTTVPYHVDDATGSPRKIKVKVASELKKSESMRKMSKRCFPTETPPPPPPQPPPPPDLTASPAGKFKSKSYLINAKSGGAAHPNETITSSLNLRRLLFSSASANMSSASNGHHATISGVKPSKKISNNVLQNNFSTAATCFLNGSATKKKRSSLFNLFSFKNGNSSASNSVAVQPSPPPPPPPPPMTKSPSSPHYRTHDSSTRDSVITIEPDDEFVNDFSASHHHDQTYIDQMMMPAQEELDESIKRLERAHSELKKQQQQHHQEHYQVPIEMRSDYEEPERRSLPKKVPSVRSKGFSIPLNASCCISSIPINFINHQQFVYHHQPQATVSHHLVALPNRTSRADQQLSSNSSLNQQPNQDFFDYDDMKAEEESELFQKKSFDLEEENSCLKEVNMRLRFAQVRSVCNDERSEFARESTRRHTRDTLSANLTRLPIRINNVSSNSNSNQHAAARLSELSLTHRIENDYHSNDYNSSEDVDVDVDNYYHPPAPLQQHHHHQYAYQDVGDEPEHEFERGRRDSDEEEETSSLLSPTLSSLLTLSINSATAANSSHPVPTTTTTISTPTTGTNNNEKAIYRHSHFNHLDEHSMFGNHLNEPKSVAAASTTATAASNKEFEKLNSESKETSDNSGGGVNSKKKRFQQFQTRSLINLNAQLKKSLQQQQQQQQPQLITAPETSGHVESESQQSSGWRMNNQQPPVVQLIKPMQLMGKAPSIRIDNSDCCYESSNHLSAFRLVYTRLRENKNASGVPDVDFEWVKVVCGSKLRDLIKPVLDEHAMNLDDYEFYKSSDQENAHVAHNEKPVDLDSNSEELAASEIHLRCKPVQQSPQAAQYAAQAVPQVAKKEDETARDDPPHVPASTPPSSQPSQQQQQAPPQQQQQQPQPPRKTTSARVLVSANSSSHLLTPNQPSYKVRKSSLQMPPPVESLIQASQSHYNALAAALSSGSGQAQLAAENKAQSSTNCNSTSSVNWQSYFNPKGSKEKLLSKQKRNSCIAVMNEFTTSPTSPVAPLLGASGQQVIITTTAATAASNTSSMNLRDSIGSFQSYVQSTSASMLSPATSNNSSVSAGRPKKNFKQIAQLSSIFTSAANQLRNIEQNRLLDKLSNYMKELPKPPEELNVKSIDMSIFEMEPDWCKHVGESFAQSLPGRMAKQQMAIWELLNTECSHIKTIKVIIDVFLCCLINLKCSEQTSELFKDIDSKKLFCNITDVFNCNLTFWTKHLHPIVTNSMTKNIIDPILLVNAFSEFKTLFAPYEEFILERNNSTEYFKQKLGENEHFAKFINWAENHPLVGRLKIADFMMIPVQRLTKYQLLIENIYQHTDDDIRREKIAQIKEIVNGLPNSINIKLNYLAQFNEISDSIERYEGIVGPTDEIGDLLGEYKTLDIKSPLPGCASTSIRELIHQGPLKLKDVSKSSFDVYCFLFTDMLLITQLKKASKKYRIIKPPVATNRMIVRELTQTDKAFVVISVNDYNVPDSVNMFISNFSRKWIEYLELSKAKYLMELKKNKTSEPSPLLERPLKSYEDYLDESSSSVELSSGIGVEFPIRPPPTPTTPSATVVVAAVCDPRRDSSATLTTHSNANSPVQETVPGAAGSTSSSSSLENNAENYSQHTPPGDGDSPTSPTAPTVAVSIRPYQKRMDRQRRNMTDPTQHHNNVAPASVPAGGGQLGADDKNSIIKRNSLNDAANRRREVADDEAPSLPDEHEMAVIKPANRGDSTSTILSTDSGVSCFDLESISIAAPPAPLSVASSSRLTKGTVTNVQQSLLKLNSLSPSSPTSSAYSSSSSSSSPAASAPPPTPSGASDGGSSPVGRHGGPSSDTKENHHFEMARLARPEENDDDDYYNDDDLNIDSSTSCADHPSRSNDSDCRPLADDNYTNSPDLNRQLMFRKHNNIRVKQSSDQNLPKHLKNLSINARKPLIKIKSTTLKNESVRVEATEIAQSGSGANFDPTVNSAHSSPGSNGPTDEDSHQRMILVNLIHATMDATEV